MAVARGSQRQLPGSRSAGLWLSVALGLVLVAIHAAGRLLWDVSSGSDLSRAFGWAAAALLLAVSALGVRKRAMSLASRLRAGRSRVWLAVHLYGGSIFLLMVLLHSDFGWPRGWVEFF